MTKRTKRPEVFAHLGPYLQHAPVGGSCELAERVWITYHELAADDVDPGQQSRKYLITRMLYIAEVTSTAIRLNATWALTHAAMSLLRDRYEQTVRFSWLARNPNGDEFGKYERAIFAKINSLIRNVSADKRKHYEELMGPIPPWAGEQLTKEERAFLDAWGTLDLRAMATKRDAFPPVADTVLAKVRLSDWYESIYAQFSSVSHYDRYSVELLGIQNGPDGSLVLAAAPYWPSLLTLQNTYFDIIQCFEAAHVCRKQDAAIIFEALLAEWLRVSKLMSQGE